MMRVHPFPSDFHTQEIETNGVTIHIRVGGKGPAGILLHGYGETGDMWAPMAEDLARDHTVVVPDLRAQTTRERSTILRDTSPESSSGPMRSETSTFSPMRSTLRLVTMKSNVT